MRLSRGFTLIELLVVIAIIAILAAILFPVFAKAREAAEQANCISNVKNITAAVLQYATNYDNRLPDSDPQFYNPSPPPGYQGWAKVVQPYIENWQIFVCPSRKEMADAWTNGEPTAGDGPLGYGYNGAFWYGCPGTGQPRDAWSGLDGKIPLSKIIQPSSTVMIADSSQACSDELGDEASGAAAGQRAPVVQDQAVTGANYDPSAGPLNVGVRFYPEPRHQGGFVVGWCDGSAKWVNFETLYDWWLWTIEKDDATFPAPPT